MNMTLNKRWCLTAILALSAVVYTSSSYAATDRLVIESGDSAQSRQQASMEKEQWNDTRSLRQKVNKRAEKEDLKVGIGGIEGRRLQDGDQVKIGKSSRRFSASRGVKQLPIGNIIRALPGPEYHEFDSVSQESFWRSPWKLSPQSNRMGYRLQGQPLRRTTDREMLSHGLLPGVVQVPHNGQPIVLMNDAQTTGGYPRIACIIEADMYQLAQIPLGQPIHFTPCSLEEALKARADQQRYLEQLAWRLSDEN